VFLFNLVHSHYMSVADQLSVQDLRAPLKMKKENHLLIVLVSSFHKGILKSIRFAKTFSDKVQAVHVDLGGAERDKLIEKWRKYKPGIELVVLDSPYRVMIETLMNYLDDIESKDPKLDVTVVIPEFVPARWWHNLLHHQTGRALKRAIHFRKRTSFISVQYHLER
ncbi:amino acid permease, partial [Candidatus Woesearchaeota archaeon]|nr:amino acid permease [Candidatus Woesearchaeota archaeon]